LRETAADQPRTIDDIIDPAGRLSFSRRRQASSEEIRPTVEPLFKAGAKQIPSIAKVTESWQFVTLSRRVCGKISREKSCK